MALDLGADIARPAARRGADEAARGGVARSASSNTSPRSAKSEKDALARAARGWQVAHGGDRSPRCRRRSRRGVASAQFAWRRHRHQLRRGPGPHRRRGAAFPERRSALLLAERARCDARRSWRPWRRSLTICRPGSTASRQRIGTLALEPRLEHVGHVLQIGDGVATVGLAETRLDELLVFEGGVRGLAVDLGEETIGCVLLGDTQRNRGREHRPRYRRGGARSGRRCAARPRGRCARRAARWRRAAGGDDTRPGRAAGAGDRRPGTGDTTAGDRASGRRRDDSARPRPARTDHRRPRHRQDRDRGRCHHQPAFERRDLRLCRDRAEGIVGRAGHRGGAPIRRAGTLPLCRRRSRLPRRACNG